MCETIKNPKQKILIIHISCEAKNLFCLAISGSIVTISAIALNAVEMQK
jgi:hypothetical protein